MALRALEGPRWLRGLPRYLWATLAEWRHLRHWSADITADGQAIGSACRHAGRALEDCFVLNPKAQRAAVFAGWREMDEYMRENKIEAVAPTLPRPGSRQAETARAEPGAAGEGPAAPDERPDTQGSKASRHAS